MIVVIIIVVIVVIIVISGQFSRFQLTQFQVEGKESQSRCLCSLQDALCKFKYPRVLAHFSGF